MRTDFAVFVADDRQHLTLVLTEGGPVDPDQARWVQEAIHEKQARDSEARA